jgi:hypothetical protein
MLCHQSQVVGAVLAPGAIRRLGGVDPSAIHRTSADGIPARRLLPRRPFRKREHHMISLSSLSITQSSGRGTPPVALGTVTVSAFSRDRTLFDSGAGFGRNTADIPLAGTGTAGEIVQARALSVDDGGATSTAWSDVATIDGAGNWSGIIAAPRSASWYRPQVRLKATPVVSAQGVSRFGVGHVIAIWGQSEPERILSTFQDIPAAPAVADDEAVQIIFGASTTPQQHFVCQGAPYTSAVAALADTLIASRPGEKFAVIFQTVSGTDPRALVNDSDPARSWVSDKALHDFATADGQHVGLAAMSWFAAPGSLGASYGEAMFPLFSGKQTNGAPVTFPATISYGSSQSYHADHWFGELYDYAHTRWVPYGPHRFDIDADLADATHYVGGAVQTSLVNKQAARASWRAMLQLPDATMFLPRGIEPLTYVNGLDDGAGGWIDYAHPSGVTADGRQAFARLTAAAVLQSADLVGWPLPVFDQCLWDPSGAWVEVWSSAGAVTTTRQARGEAPLAATYAHWTEVAGFQINGSPAQSAQIVAGRVRIFPNAGVFTQSDALSFGEGGASGAVKFPQDYVAGLWKNLPIVDLGVAGLDGIPVSAMPAASVLANTLPAVAASFATSASGPYFLDPINVPAGVTGITFAARIRLPALPSLGSYIIFTQAASGFDVEVLNNGSLRLNVKDGAGVKTVNNAILAAGLGAGVWYDLVCAGDHVAQNVKVAINGSIVGTVPFTTSGNGVFQSNRALGFLARNNGTLQFIGDVEHARVWHSVTGTATVPAAAPYKSIAGPASLANADAWKLGANAT